jgi:hypothetical protein
MSGCLLRQAINVALERDNALAFARVDFADRVATGACAPGLHLVLLLCGLVFARLSAAGIPLAAGMTQRVGRVVPPWRSMGEQAALFRLLRCAIPPMSCSND